VIADFENNTGDPVFDETLKQGLTVQLQQSPYINILSDRKVRDTLKLMNHPASEPFTEAVGREVCLRSNSKAMLVGAIAKPDDGYDIGIKAVDCNVGATIAEVQEKAASKEAILKALDRAALAMRAKLGESLGSVQRYATPLQEATTPSLEALRAYSIASKTRYSESSRAAIPLYKRAVELDPNFAMAFRSLAQLYGNVGQGERAQECSRKAYELRHGVSERERLAIEGDYFDRVTGELYKAAQTYEAWQRSYPGDSVAATSLTTVYNELGDLEKDLEAARAAMRLDPNSYVSYENLADAYGNLNRLDEQEQVFKQVKQRFGGGAFLYVNWYELAFLKGNETQMAQMAALATGEPGVDVPRLASQEGTEAWHGRMKNARRLGEQALESARREGSPEGYLVLRALSRVLLVSPQQTRADASGALKGSNDPDIKAKAALALVMAGDTALAQKLEAELDKAYPLSTKIQDYWLPTIRAARALQAKEPAGAIELLKKTSAIELGDGCLCSAYLRGHAFLSLDNAEAAAAEFHKFIDHYGIVSDFTWGVLARLDLARAYSLESKTNPAYHDKALTAYQNFLTLWKDADPDIPIYRQAKAEYKKLSATGNQQLATRN
jgi:tetratricopeptide (TPR) repeat protein